MLSLRHAETMWVVHDSSETKHHLLTKNHNVDDTHAVRSARCVIGMLCVALQSLKGLLEKVVGFVRHVSHKLVLHCTLICNILVAHFKRLVHSL